MFLTEAFLGGVGIGVGIVVGILLAAILFIVVAFFVGSNAIKADARKKAKVHARELHKEIDE